MTKEEFITILKEDIEIRKQEVERNIQKWNKTRSNKALKVLKKVRDMNLFHKKFRRYYAHATSYGSRKKY